MKTEQVEMQRREMEISAMYTRIKKELVDMPTEGKDSVQNDENVECIKEAQLSIKTEPQNKQSKKKAGKYCNKKKGSKMKNKNQILKTEMDKYRREYLERTKATEQKLLKTRQKENKIMKEMANIRNENQSMKAKNKSLKADVDKYQSEYLERTKATKQELLKMRQKENKIMKEMENIRNENQSMKAKNKSLKADVDKYQKEYLERTKATEQQLSNMQEKENKMTKDMANVRKKNKLMKAKKKSLKADVDKYRAEYLGLARATEQQMTEMRTQLQKEVSEIYQMKERLNELENRNQVDNSQQYHIHKSIPDYTPPFGSKNTFEWCVYDWFNKIYVVKKEIYSEPFYSHPHGYKMCLSLRPQNSGAGKGTHLGVSFHIMKGPFDDILLWPFKQNVTMSLINQRTYSPYTTYTAVFDNDPHNCFRNKPHQIRSNGIGYSQFVSLGALATINDLWKNGVIIIQCQVSGFDQSV